MKFHGCKVKNTAKILGRFTSMMSLAALTIGLTACGGGGGGGSGTVTNNGTLTNPQNYTMPGGGVATVPPTGN